MKILLLALAALVLLVVFAWIVGALLPRDHLVTRSVVLRQPTMLLFAVVCDFARHPEWRSDVHTVEILPPGNALGRHRETSRHGVMTFAVRVNAARRQLVTEIDDASLPFGGSWIIDFTPMDDVVTRVRVTERGFVRPAFFRFLARFVFGHTRTMENYLRDLSRKFGEAPVIET